MTEAHGTITCSACGGRFRAVFGTARPIVCSRCNTTMPSHEQEALEAYVQAAISNSRPAGEDER